MKVLCGYIFKCAVLLLAAHFGSLFADNILELRRLQALHRRAQREVTSLRRENLSLLAEAHALRHDPFYVELTMRRKLRWVRPGEGLAPRAATAVCAAADDQPPHDQ